MNALLLWLFPDFSSEKDLRFDLLQISRCVIFFGAALPHTVPRLVRMWKIRN